MTIDKKIIKFRAWDGNKMLSWEELGQTYEDDGSKEWFQFTGTKDSKGREIYEGDIVKIVDTKQWTKDWIKNFTGNALVKWVREGCEYWVAFDEMNGKWLLLRGTYWNESEDEMESENLKVIGNIKENPELIK